ncbi:MAG: kelch-like protein [Deltaproteobacteria bacterium]|nr:kelch-like protein [Deltaproteobacteria bacterium]
MGTRIRGHFKIVAQFVVLGLFCLSYSQLAAQTKPTSEWSKRAPLLEPNSEMAVAQLDGKIYIVGGYPSTRISVDTVQVYDIKSDSWRLTTPYPTTINHASAVGLDGILYVIGGQTNAGGQNEESRYTSAVYAYDPKTEKWSARAPMPTARSAMAHDVIDGKIYVAGGRPPRGHDFAVYDPKADKWTALPDMPTARNHMAAAGIDGKLYVPGGRFGGGFRSEITPVLEVYDPKTNTWTPKRPMSEARSGLNGIAVEGCFHTFGGEHPTAGPSGVFPHHEAYDPKTDRWTRLADIPIPVHGVTGLAYANGWIHLPGGGTEMGGSSGSTHHQVIRPGMKCN